MPFTHRNKEVLGGGTAVRLFGYKTLEPVCEVIKPDYFQYWSELQINDWLFLTCGDGVFMAVVRSKKPTIIGTPDDPWGLREIQPVHALNRLRTAAKELGINSFGKGIQQLTEEITAKHGIKL